MSFFKKFLAMGLSLSTLLSVTCMSLSAEASEINRFSGANRSETSFDTSNLPSLEKGQNIVIADGYNFADSLSAMNLANKFNAQLLLDSNIDVTNNQVESYLSLFSPKNLYLVGGKEVKKYSKNKYKNTNIVHISGNDRYETNRKSLQVAGYKDVGVASGENYADALSSYSLLKEKNLGIMLVKPTENYNSNGYNVKYTFGGTNSVKKNGGERIAGSDRYDTSAKIAAKTGYKDIAFVSGTSFADALSAVNVVNNSETSDILLTPTNGNKEVSKLAKAAENIYIVGGEKTLPQKNVDYAIEGKALIVPAVKKPVVKPAVKKPTPKPVVKKAKTSITVPGTNGKVRINLPSNVASRIEFDPSGKYIINKKAYEYTHNLDSSTVIGIYLQDYVGTNKDHHNFAESNTYGTFVKNGKRYSLCGDYSFISFRYNDEGDLTQHNIDEMFVDLHAILHALETHNTTGLIH